MNSETKTATVTAIETIISLYWQDQCALYRISDHQIQSIPDSFTYKLETNGYDDVTMKALLWVPGKCWPIFFEEWSHEKRIEFFKNMQNVYECYSSAPEHSEFAKYYFSHDDADHNLLHRWIFIINEAFPNIKEKHKDKEEDFLRNRLV